MSDRRPFHLDRKSRRLLITLPEEDWTLLAEEAQFGYLSVSGLVALIVDAWCDEKRTRKINRQIAEGVKADLARAGEER